eukprot:7231558-Prymnesium_polylepis.1
MNGIPGRTTVELSRLGQPTWDIHWEAHNVLAPEPLATTELARAAALNSSSLHTLIGYFETHRECQEHVMLHREARSFTYIFPSHRQRGLRGACFAIFSERWEPSITGEA